MLTISTILKNICCCEDVPLKFKASLALFHRSTVANPKFLLRENTVPKISQGH